MADMYQVSRYTIQEAIKILEDIGIVKSVQGSGMFIQKQFQLSPLIFNTLTRTPYDRISSKAIYLEKKKSTLEKEQIFQLNNSEDIWTFERVRIGVEKVIRVYIKLFINIFFYLQFLSVRRNDLFIIIKAVFLDSIISSVSIIIRIYINKTISF